MKKTIILGIVFTAITAGPGSAIANLTPDIASAPMTRKATPPIRLAHAQPFRHCHNVHTRVYCHRTSRLPMTWPPFSDRRGSGTRAASDQGAKK